MKRLFLVVVLFCSVFSCRKSDDKEIQILRLDSDNVVWWCFSVVDKDGVDMLDSTNINNVISEISLTYNKKEYIITDKTPFYLPEPYEYIYGLKILGDKSSLKNTLLFFGQFNFIPRNIDFLVQIKEKQYKFNIKLDVESVLGEDNTIRPVYHETIYLNGKVYPTIGQNRIITLVY